MSSIPSEYVRHHRDAEGSIAILRPNSEAAELVLSRPVFDPPAPRARTDAPSERKVEFDADRLTDLGCRIVNVAVAAVSLVLLMPLMLAIAVAVRLSSRGPVLYRQLRVGRDFRSGRDRRGGRPMALGAQADPRRKFDYGGRTFSIYKFRTMVHRPHDRAQVWASANDDRITPVGRFLRHTRLDELPQLWNVLVGDMNVVGPRPEQPEIFQELRKEIRHYQRRQIVPPGITGWAQINQAYDTSIDDVEHKILLDLEYIERRSTLEDVKIMARTIPVMVLRRGAL